MKFFPKVFFLRTKLDLRLKKKTNIILRQVFKIFVSPSKNASHTISLYGNCMVNIFFKKKFNQFFFATSLFNCSQRAAEMV